MDKKLPKLTLRTKAGLYTFIFGTKKSIGSKGRRLTAIINGFDSHILLHNNSP